jgi:nucleotidyltransferase/DNA polymerase involved in DNA repair
VDEGQIRKIIHIDMDAFYASVEQRDELQAVFPCAPAVGSLTA